MEIRIKETGNVVLEQEFRAMFPNTSLPFPLTGDIINQLGGDVVLNSPTPNVSRYQVAHRDGVQYIVPMAAGGDTSEITGTWFTKYTVVDMDQEARDALDAQQAISIRSQRDTKLVASDWTQARDVNLANDAEWAAYRQALRDISDQSGFPWDVEWPTQPN